MAKGGGSGFERATSSCLTGIIWLVFLCAVAFGIYMVVVMVAGPVAPGLLDVFSDAPASYKEAHRHYTSEEYELAIQKYNTFLEEEGDQTSQERLVQAHMEIAASYLQLARELNYNDPQYRSKLNRWCTKGMDHCDEVLKMHPGHKGAEERKTLLSITRG